MRRSSPLLLIPLGLSACGLSSAFSTPTDSPLDRAPQPTTMIEVSLSTVDRDAAIASALSAVRDAAARGDRVILVPLDGTATGSTTALDRSPPAAAANGFATAAEQAEWRDDVVADASAALEALEPPAVGTTVDLAEAVEVGLAELESISPDEASQLIVVTSGYQRASVDVGGAVADVAPPGPHPASVWLVGIGDLSGVDPMIARGAAVTAVGTAGAVCGQVAPRGCHVLQSLAATAGGS